MLLFVRRVPDSVSRSELRQFINKAVRPRWRLPFGVRGTLEKCDILRITDKDAGTVEHHGLVKVEPARSALLAIHKLNGTRLKDKRVEVRKYYHRSPLRDRRSRVTMPDNLDFSDRRRQDRRRSNLTLETAGNTNPDGETGFSSLQI